MRHLLLVSSVLTVLAPLPAQTPGQPKATPFQTQLLTTMKRRPFFKDVSFDVEAQRAPFLFFVQASLRRDEKNYVNLVINPFFAHLTKLLRVFDETYCKPQGLTMRADAQQVAIAVLASRGLYDDYAREVQDAFLHQSLAHYDHDLRLAVTYRAGFGAGDQQEQRQSLLHEVVHALQHAYSTTGEMPKPMWFDEGLAEYRSSSTHIADSLTDPPLLDDHVEWMLYGVAHPEGKKLLLPIADLVVPDSYAQVVEAARARAGQVVDAGAAIGMFYAQSEMFVRFLHEALDKKHRAGFLRYFKAVETGAAGLAAFREAFGVNDEAGFTALEQEWRTWLGRVFEKRLGVAVDMQSGKGLERHAMPPPTEFDPAPLAWRDDELLLRLTAVQRICALGEYDRALAMLPARAGGGPANDARLAREREAVQALVELRDKVVADLQKRGTVDVGGQRGRFVRRDGDDVVIAAKQGEVTVRLSPGVLREQGERLKAFASANCWKEVLLRWLAGESRASLAPRFARDYNRLKDLQADLTADVDAEHGAEALALERFRQVTMPADRDGARALLAELRETTGRGGPLFAARKQAIERLARALAERAFDLDDAEALGIHGKLEALADGRVRIVYDDPAAAPDADFTLMTNSPFQFVDQSRIPYGGPTCVQPANGQWAIVGKGFLQWAVPLTGPQELQFDFQLPGQGSELVLLLCVAPGRHLQVTASGRLLISDQTTNTHGEAGKTGVTIGQPHRLAVTHDGKARVAVQLDGTQTAEFTAVGNCLGGAVMLGVSSSTPVPIRNLAITGRLDPSDPTAARERFVARVLAALWQPAAGGGADEAAADPKAAGEEPDAAPSPRARRAKALERSVRPAVDGALRWLVQHQDEDGRWDADGFMKHDREGPPSDGPGDAMHDVGVTALALLSLSANGVTGRSGVHKAAYRRGIEWLVAQQNLENGCFVPDLAARRIYDHALATLATIEAAAFTGDERWRRAAQQGMQYLELHRNPYSCFGYGPRDNNNTMSLTAWCVETYCAAESTGLEVNKTALQLMATFYDQVSDPTGNHGYTKQGEGSSRDDGAQATRYPITKTATLTAAGLFGRYLLGQDPKSQPIMNAAAAIVTGRPPRWDVAGGGIDECYFYFGSHALYQHGGPAWNQWRKAMLTVATDAQRKDGNFAGSWDPVGAWSDHGGRVYSTAMLALSLLAPARYARLMR